MCQPCPALVTSVAPGAQLVPRCLWVLGPEQLSGPGPVGAGWLHTRHGPAFMSMADLTPWQPRLLCPTHLLYR